MAIELKNICKNYGEKEVLKDVNLTLNPNEITYIMGTSGIGKTTLINIIAGLVKPDSGQIFGMESKRISFVFQEDRLLEWETALANVLFVKSSAKAYVNEAKALLDKAGLADSINKKAAELSGGMKRRVCICRALLADYDLLILDEPFKGLDEETKPVIMQLVKDNLREGAYVLCVTHDATEAEFLGGKRLTI